MAIDARRLLWLTVTLCLFGSFIAAPAHAEPIADTPDDLIVTDQMLAPAGAILTKRDDASVAPGVHYTSFSRYSEQGWLRGDLLMMDLTNEDTFIDYVDSGKVSATATLTDQLRGAGAVAGVNGEGFDINNTGAALGMGIQSGETIKGYGPDASNGRGPSAIFGTDGLAEVAQLFVEGTASDGENSYTIDYLNQPRLLNDTVALFTPRWGDEPVSKALSGSGTTWFVVVNDNTVVTSSADAFTGTLSDGEQLLIGRGSGATQMKEFTPGETLTITYAPKGADDIRAAINGFFPVAIDGQVVTTNDTELHPRTILALTADGTRMALVTIDGRQSASRGMTEVETAEFLLGMGFDDVLNLDGGGSSQMNARLAGQDTPGVRSNPSDGVERQTANSVGIFVEPGSGIVAGHTLVATHSGAGADDDTSKDLVVMKGLTRAVTAEGYDENLAPVATEPHWANSDGNTSIATGEGANATITGIEPGVGEIAITSGETTTTHDVLVIGAPTRLTTSVRQVSLPTQETTGTFQVIGHDSQGFSTWLEPTDVTLDYDTSQAEITVEGDHFHVTPLVESGAVVVKASVGQASTELAVTIGLASVVADDLSTGAGWLATRYPTAVPEPSFEIVKGAGHDGEDALAFNYSLTGTTATRAAYLAYPERIDLPGTPQRIGLWVKGDGQGAWLRGNLYQAGASSPSTVNFGYVTWTGWKYVEAEVPAGLTMPLEFFRFYVVETNKDKQYSGQILFQDLTIRSAPQMPVLDQPREIDPAINTSEPLPADWWRYAVVSDAQFTADAPQSDIVQAARRSLREAVAQDPDFIVIDGDWVDRGFAEDIALANQILSEEVPAEIPVHYVPGNHEAAGTENLDVWQDTFGEPWYTFDHKGTRVIVRATPGYTMRSGGFDQILDLKTKLDEAAADDSINNVVVFQHHPITEISPTGGSTLTDAGEAELLQDWLTDFRFSTGKGIALHSAGTGTFEATQYDGVHQFTNGNAGKSPNGSPAEGGFTGWSVAAINPNPTPATFDTSRWSEGDQWISMAYVPHVDSLEVSAEPATVELGEATSISATVIQDGRRVPVAYPVHATYTVSDGATFDPATGTLSAPKPGTYTVTVTVNNVSESIEVEVTDEQRLPEHFTTPGLHTVDGERFSTMCEPYQETARCWTYQWGEKVNQVGDQFIASQGWVFRNLTYLPWMTRDQWGDDPRATPGRHVVDGKQWLTECDTVRSGQDACQSWVLEDYTLQSRTRPDGTQVYFVAPQWVYQSVVFFLR